VRAAVAVCSAIAVITVITAIAVVAAIAVVVSAAVGVGGGTGPDREVLALVALPHPSNVSGDLGLRRQ
jgi:hypothetical protein